MKLERLKPCPNVELSLRRIKRNELSSWKVGRLNEFGSSNTFYPSASEG